MRWLLKLQEILDQRKMSHLVAAKLMPTTTTQGLLQTVVSNLVKMLRRSVVHVEDADLSV